MVILRDGQTALDPRLDALKEKDERSRDFPITAVVPTGIYSRAWRLIQRLNQGKQGQCVSYAFHHEACAMPVPRQTPTTEQIRDRYFDMQRIDPWAGGEYPGATPQYGGTSTLAGAKVMQAAGFFDEYRWAFGLNDVLRALTHEGPVVLSLDWYEDMFYPDARGLIKVGGSLAGGHCILARGLNTSKREVILRQSWGVDHGVYGDVRIGWDDLDRLLQAGGEACVPVGRK